MMLATQLAFDSNATYILANPYSIPSCKYTLEPHRISFPQIFFKQIDEGVWWQQLFGLKELFERVLAVLTKSNS